MPHPHLHSFVGLRVLRAFVVTSVLALSAAPTFAADPALKQGDRVDLNGRYASLVALDTLPYDANNKLLPHYQFDKYGDAELEKLRRDNHLDDVVAPGSNEFEKQLLLMEWVHQQIEYGDPDTHGKVRDPLELLNLSRKGTVLYCECFASLYISSAASLGWVARPIDIPTHSFTEIWSNQYHKWIMMDPNGNFYAELHGVPLSAYELRKEWFEKAGKGDMLFKRGRERYECHGRSSFSMYTLLYYMYKREWLGTRPEAGGMCVKDQYSGSRGARYPVFENPATEAYPTINQAALTLQPDGRDLRVSVKTFTPNFKTFRTRQDNGPWTDASDDGGGIHWALHSGLNVLNVASVNLFGIAGPMSTAEVYLTDKPSNELFIPADAFSAEGGGTARIRSYLDFVDPAYVLHWDTSGHTLQYTFDSPADAEYEVTLSYASLFHPARELSINGQVAPGLEHFTVGPTLRWDNFSDSLLPAKIKVHQGKNTLSIKCLDDITLLLSEIRLTNPKLPDILIPATSYTGETGGGGGKAQRMVSATHGYFRFWDKPGHWLEWKINAPEAGRYVLLPQYGALRDARRDLLLNGKPIPGMETITLPGTTNWQTWGEFQLPQPLPLSKGENTLRLTNTTGDGLNMAGFRVTGSTSGELYVPATDFSVQGGEHVTVYEPTSHRTIYNWVGKNHWFEWTLHPAAAGDYRVVIRASAPGATSHELLLNGQPVQGFADFSLPATGSLETWQDTTLPGTLHLKAGENILRITSRDGHAISLDTIRLLPVMGQ